MTAVDPASGGVRVYLPGFGWEEDLAGGVAQQVTPGLFGPLTGVRDMEKERMTALDVTAAYATLGAAGVERKPHLVSTVTGADGSTRYQAPDTAKPVIGEHVVDRITASLKEDAVCNGVPCVPYAAPWMVGYTPQLAVTVYVKKADVADAGLPRVIWQEFLAELSG
jgi:membrane peptidoglycan carboxypeptidase